MASGSQAPLAVLSVAVVIACAALPAAAQRSGGGAGAEVVYDPATEVTLRGTVQEVKAMKTVTTVTHLVLLKGDHSTIEVHLGPSSWMAKQRVVFTLVGLALFAAWLGEAERREQAGAPAVPKP